MVHENNIKKYGYEYELYSQPQTLTLVDIDVCTYVILDTYYQYHICLFVYL